MQSYKTFCLHILAPKVDIEGVMWFLKFKTMLALLFYTELNYSSNNSRNV